MLLCLTESLLLIRPSQEMKTKVTISADCLTYTSTYVGEERALMSVDCVSKIIERSNLTLEKLNPSYFQY